MARALLVFMTSVICCIGYGQSITSLKPLKPDTTYDNILVKKLSSDKFASAFVIWIKEGVKAHKHEVHTENLYVVEGKGDMKIGSETIQVKPGDYFVIPPGTAHSLKVTSGKAMKVLSVQSPEFLGKDRIFIDKL